jgi:hypothetical protein
MVNLSGILIILIFTLPIILGLTVSLINTPYRREWFMGLILFILFGVLGLRFLGEVDLVTPISFLGEVITLSISNAALLIYFVSLLILLGMVLIVPEDEKSQISGFKLSLFSISLSFGFIAFISGQFMIRYIALDIVGLMAALMVLNPISDKKAYNRFSVIFAILRFGDLSLLASILLLNYQSNTLDISQMINSVLDLPMNIQAWIFGGFFVAVLVKTAIWPFSLWMNHAYKATRQSQFWVSGVLMPSLGYYLLYRVQPIIVSNELFKNIIWVFSALIIVMMILFDITNQNKSNGFIQMGGILTCFLFAATVYGPKGYLSYYIAALLIYRFLLYLREKNSSFLPSSKMIVIIPVVINVFYLGFSYRQLPPIFMAGWLSSKILIVVWDSWWRQKQTNYGEQLIRSSKAFPGEDLPWERLRKGALWLNRNLENKLFTKGIYSFSESFKQSAVWLNEKVEIGVFTNGFYTLSKGLENLSDWLSNSVEQGMEKLWAWVGRTLMKISESTFTKLEVDSAKKSEALLDGALNTLEDYEQNVLRKNLRLDLAWIPLFLLAIILLILIV